MLDNFANKICTRCFAGNDVVKRDDMLVDKPRDTVDS
jgi:hypothetical protein